MEAEAMFNNSQYEVLNISNVNSQGDIVLNDELLLEIIQLFPLLYHPSSQAYQDPDYLEWTWERIANDFNRSYQGIPTFQNFSPIDLERRWGQLRPIIKSLSKACDINVIPAALRQIVIKINAAMENEQVKIPPFSSTQSLILNQIPMVEKLKPNDRGRLEAEIMECLVANELLSSTELVGDKSKKVENGFKHFLKLIDFKKPEPHTGSKIEPTCSRSADSDISRITSQYNLRKSFKPIVKLKKIITIKPEFTDNWVPMSKAYKFVRPCKIRIKRINLEDYNTLATIKNERNW